VLSACGRGATPTPEPVAPHLSLVPCGGTAQMTRPGSSAWEPVNTQIAVDAPLRVAPEGDGNARLCFGDRSVLELAPGSEAELRPAEDGSRLEIAVETGGLRLLAYERSYQFATPACPVRVSGVPARVVTERIEAGTRVRVEKGSVVCADPADPTLVPTCWELVAVPGEPVRVEPTCGAAVGPDVAATATPGALAPATGTPAQSGAPTAIP